MTRTVKMNWLATSLSLTAAMGLVLGCGGGEKADDATVTVPDPINAAGGAAAPAAAGGGAAPAPAATGDTSKPAGGAPAVKAEGFGTLKGRVVFAGDPPAHKMLIEKGQTKDVKDANVCAANGIPSEELIVDAATKGVKNAIVYIPRPTAVKPEAESAAKAVSVEFDQKGCIFEPHVVAVMKGAKIEVKSNDPIGHNVNAALVNNTKFNTQIPPNSPPMTVVTKSQESAPIKIVCDIHGWMSAWWFIANNPYFAVTNEKGEFEIKDVPAGTQKVVVWAESIAPKGYLTPPSGEPLDIKADGETTKEYMIDAGKVKK